MRTLSVCTLLVGGSFILPAAADDPAKDKPLMGNFTCKAGDLDLKIEFKKDNVMDYHVSVGNDGCIMTSKYTREKDGTYKFVLTHFEKKGDFPASKDKGYQFRFKVEVKDKKIVVSDLDGDDINADQKQAVEGEYEQAK
jgi:hypothetical protein